MTPIACILFVISFCAIWYGAMILIGLVFESRLVPMGKLQSKAYFPGDIAVGTMILAIYREYYEFGYKVPTYWPAVVIPVTIGLFLFNYWLLKGDWACYERRASHSPTKIWHDFVGFYILEPLIVNMALLVLVGTIFGSQSFGSIADPIMFAVAFAFYMSCDIWDVKHPATKKMIEARHSVNWKPIWKKAP